LGQDKCGMAVLHPEMGEAAERRNAPFRELRLMLPV
jgi:hypothetical protein